MDTAATAILVGYETSYYLGDVAVSPLGDATGDGVPDLVVGVAAIDAEGGCEGEGAAFVVAGPFGGEIDLEVEPVATLSGDGPIDCDDDYDVAGYAVAGVGDVNGDGLADFLVGAPGHEPTGRAFLVRGPPPGDAVLEDVATAVFYGLDLDLTYEWLTNSTGESLSGAGDVDGDGVPDLLIGEPLGGRAYLISGDVTGEVDLETESRTVIYGDLQLGTVALGLGDVDGDGLDDVAVSGDDTYGFDVGVFMDPPAGRVDIAEADIRFGEDVLGSLAGGPGDVDGDGHADIVVLGLVAPDDYSAMAAWVFELDGTPALLDYDDAAASLAAPESTASDEAISVAPNPVGDFNADGHLDLALGLYEFTSPGPGAAYVALGPFSGSTLLDDMGALRLHSEGATDNLGRAVAGAGDLDDDGFDDVLVTAPGYDGVVEDGGAVYVLGGFSI